MYRFDVSNPKEMKSLFIVPCYVSIKSLEYDRIPIDLPCSVILLEFIMRQNWKSVVTYGVLAMGETQSSQSYNYER